MGLMLVGKALPNDDHVARGCSRGVKNNIVTSAAFEPRPQDKFRLSVEWVECPHANPSERNLEGAIERIKSIPVRGPYANLGVLDIRSPTYNGRSLDVVELLNRPCHAAIIGFTGDSNDLLFQDDLAEIANKSPLSN